MFFKVQSGTFDTEKGVLVCDPERDATAPLGVVETAQLGHILFTSLVNVDVTRCTHKHTQNTIET